MILLHTCDYDFVFFLENGHWLIGDKYQNVGEIKTKKTDLDEIPTVGWLFYDGIQWKEAAIEVTGSFNLI